MAVKLKQQFGRDRPSVMVYDEEEAKRRYLAWQEAVNKEVAVRVDSQVEPPDMTVAEFQLQVVSLSSPDVFWVRYGQRSAERMAIVERVISTCLPNLHRVKSARELVVGNLVIAPYKEDGEDAACYYRARVESVEGGHATVFFIDYGNLDMLPARELLTLPASVLQSHPDLVQCPGLALECRLAQLQPSSLRSSNGVWDGEAVARFQQLLDEGANKGRLVGKIFSVVKSDSGLSEFVVALEEVVVRSHVTKDIEVREILLKEHLAEFATESYNSQKNHEERRDFKFHNEHMQKHLNSFAAQQSCVSTVKPQNEVAKQQLKVCFPLLILVSNSIVVVPWSSLPDSISPGDSLWSLFSTGAQAGLPPQTWRVQDGFS